MNMILDTPQQINAFRLRTIATGIKLEMRGLKLSRGKSCYSIAKSEFGFKGNRQSVLDQLLNKMEGLK
jgi:hypothetical protein|tara:strand:+ start:1696 stop:1899 length:204 start_codon:yes stop_codon:yes gene_type:complete